MSRKVTPLRPEDVRGKVRMTRHGLVLKGTRAHGRGGPATAPDGTPLLPPDDPSRRTLTQELCVVIPGLAPNPANRIERVKARMQRTKRQRTDARTKVALALRARLGNDPPALPAVVVLTRITPGKPDTDGPGTSVKNLRDGVADAFRTTDATGAGLAFSVVSAKGPAAVEIRVWPVNWTARSDEERFTAECGGIHLTVQRTGVIVRKWMASAQLIARTEGMPMGGVRMTCMDLGTEAEAKAEALEMAAEGLGAWLRVVARRARARP